VLGLFPCYGLLLLGLGRSVIVGIFGVDTLFDTILRIVCKNHTGWPELLETEFESV